MQAPAHITTPAQYLANLDEPRRSALTMIHHAIRQAAPELRPVIVSGILGYGPYRYRYESGREGDTALICLASQRAYISLYMMAVDGEKDLVQESRATLGKVSVGKSCIRFKKLEDLNLPAFLAMIPHAVRLSAADPSRTG